MIRACRHCGCTDDRACVVDGVPCHWIGADVCSACSTPAEPDPAAPSRSTRRCSPTLLGAHFDLDDQVADGINDSCSACPGDGIIPAGDQIWWKPSFGVFDDCDPLCRRCAFDQVRWPASYVRAIRRSRPWVGVDLQVARR